MPTMSTSKGKARATSPPPAFNPRHTIVGLLTEWEGFGKKGRKGQMGPPPDGFADAFTAARVSNSISFNMRDRV